MQRTMNAGPARRVIKHRPRSNPAGCIHMFRKHVGHVVVRADLAHLDVAVRHVLSNFEIATVDVA
eukprot:5697936-Pleurochrysis_carterae.AAC.1